MQQTQPERRTMPRYPVDTRIFASIDGQTVLLSNISTTGVALYATGLAVGSLHTLEIHLARRHMTLAVQVLDISTDRLLHARFVDPGEDALGLVVDYIESLI